MNDLLHILSGVADPEIPVLSIVDLGIVREVNAQAVTLTPTYTGCPATFAIEAAVRAALDQAGHRDIAIRTVLDPPWSSEWISPQGRDKLRAYGIAPPCASGPPACPHCGAADTREVSRFGSTACKAQWRCLACAEPFDYFKCH